MKCQVTGPRVFVALQGQFLAGTHRVMGRTRGGLRSGVAADANPCVLIACNDGRRCGVRLRTGLTGRKGCLCRFPGIASRAGGPGLTGRNRMGGGEFARNSGCRRGPVMVSSAKTPADLARRTCDNPAGNRFKSSAGPPLKSLPETVIQPFLPTEKIEEQLYGDSAGDAVECSQ